MGSLNRATLLGNVGSQPEIKTFQNGQKVAQFSLATSEPAYTLQNGTQVPEKTEWHSIVVWGNMATIVERYLPKGAQVYVEGKIRSRQYEKDGQKRYVTEIIAENVVLLKNNGTPATQTQPQGAVAVPTGAPTQVGGTTCQQPAESGTEDENGGLPF